MMSCGCTATPPPYCIDHLPPPPDAGDSFLGVYGLGHPWTQWLLNRASELLAQTPREALRPEQAPLCPQCALFMQRRRMVLRPGFWVCYHDPPVRIRVEPRIPPAPEGKVLHRTDEILEALSPT